MESRWRGSTVRSPRMTSLASSDTMFHWGPEKENSPPRMRCMIASEVALRLYVWKGVLPDSMVYWKEKGVGILYGTLEIVLADIKREIL